MVATVMLATIAALVVVDITSTNAQVRLREHLSQNYSLSLH
jgi:hypothetical protein